MRVWFQKKEAEEKVMIIFYQDPRCQSIFFLVQENKKKTLSH